MNTVYINSKNLIPSFRKAIKEVELIQREKEEDLFLAVHNLITKSFWHRVLFFHPCNDKADESFSILLDDVDFEYIPDFARKNCIERALFYAVLNNIRCRERQDIYDLEKERKQYEAIIFALETDCEAKLDFNDFDLFKARVTKEYV